jgi:predicted metal-dependent enzyme (double-stranded beta helix superfamily)
MTDISPLRDFVVAMTHLVARTQDEPTLLREGRALLAPLLADDRWLPEDCAVLRPDRYAQYLLHADPLERCCDEFHLQAPDAPPRDTGRSHVMQPGDIEAVSPTVGDWHRVSSARTDGASISIHVYGANIGAVRRHRLDDAGRVIDFVSGYDSRTVPNLWDRSKAPPQPVPQSAGAAARDAR